MCSTTTAPSRFNIRQSVESGITFRFTADSRWDAIGTLSDDSLEVRYNMIMEMSDFENAVYTRSR
jgi:hypothetical protein